VSVVSEAREDNFQVVARELSIPPRFVLLLSLREVAGKRDAG
jgi:hypothetical protein